MTAGYETLKRIQFAIADSPEFKPGADLVMEMDAFAGTSEFAQLTISDYKALRKELEDKRPEYLAQLDAKG